MLGIITKFFHCVRFLRGSEMKMFLWIKRHIFGLRRDIAQIEERNRAVIRLQRGRIVLISAEERVGNNNIGCCHYAGSRQVFVAG